jgi:hypothetical protein
MPLPTSGDVTMKYLRQGERALRVAEALADARRLVATVERERAGASGARAGRLDEIRRKRENAPGPYPQEMLISQLGVACAGPATRDPLNPIPLRGNRRNDKLLVFRGLPSIGAGGRFFENRTPPVETAPQAAPSGAAPQGTPDCPRRDETERIPGPR